jgi:predicted DNA-binding transcriptional regulator YafY
MANTSSRTLRLLSLLQARRFWSGPELAGRLEVSPRTLRRDVERLRDLGYPVDARPGVDGGYELAPGVALPPLVLDDEEAVALGVGLQSAIQNGTVVGIAESSVRALAKVVHVMPPRLRRQVDALATMVVAAGWDPRDLGIDPGLLTTIAAACRDRERLRFGYLARSGERTERRVEPHRLVLLGRRWYMVAWDPTRDDWRSFRLDRLDELRNERSGFAPRELPMADAAEFVRMSIESVPAPYTVEAVVHAPAATVRTQLGRWASVEELDDGRCRLRMTADSLEWPTHALGVTGADFDVLSPPELRDHLRDWGRRFGRAARRRPDEATPSDSRGTPTDGIRDSTGARLE